MKNLRQLVFTLVIILAFTSCKKDPKDVVLTADKTSVTKGSTITFTCKDNGTAKWFNYSIKKPNESAFSDSDLGAVTGEYALRVDSTGVYTVYVEAYACKNEGNYSKLKECKGQTKSNEISITVTP